MRAHGRAGLGTDAFAATLTWFLVCKMDSDWRAFTDECVWFTTTAVPLNLFQISTLDSAVVLELTERRIILYRCNFGNIKA